MLPGSGRFSAGGGRRSCRVSINAGGFPADTFQNKSEKLISIPENVIKVVVKGAGLRFCVRSLFFIKEYPYRRLIKGSIFAEKPLYAQVRL